MRPTDAKAAIHVLVQANTPGIFWSGPGCGKSRIAEQLAAEMDKDYLDVRVLLHDPSDFKFPMPDLATRTVHWVQSVFPRDPDWNGIIVLEEIDKAAPLQQNALLGLVLERRLGEYTLPEKAYILATANRVEDKAGSHRLVTTLCSRFVHIDLDVSLEDWMAWAIASNVSAEVRAFLNYRPKKLYEFDANSGERAFPCPRTWEFVSKILPHTPSHLLMGLLSGTVGRATAAEFVGFLQIYRELPSLDPILNDPANAPVPREPAILYALSGAVSERMRNATEREMGNVMAYAMRLPDEFSVLMGLDSAAANQRIMQVKAADPWMKKHKHVLMRKSA